MITNKSRSSSVFTESIEALSHIGTAFIKEFQLKLMDRNTASFLRGK